MSERLDHWCSDFLPELSRLFLECKLHLKTQIHFLFELECMRMSILIISVTCLVAFDAKFNCFSSNELNPNSLSSRLMDAALTANSLILNLDHMKDIKKSRHWKKFEEAMLLMEEYVPL